MIPDIKSTRELAAFLASDEQAVVIPVEDGERFVYLWKLKPLGWPDYLDRFQIVYGDYSYFPIDKSSMLTFGSLGGWKINPLFVYDTRTNDIVYFVCNSFNVDGLFEAEDGVFFRHQSACDERFAEVMASISAKFVEMARYKVATGEIDGECPICEERIDHRIFCSYVKTGDAAEPDEMFEAVREGYFGKFASLVAPAEYEADRVLRVSSKEVDAAVQWVLFDLAWGKRVAELSANGAFDSWKMRREVYRVVDEVAQGGGKSVRCVFEDREGEAEYPAGVDAVICCCLVDDAEFNLADNWYALRAEKMDPRFTRKRDGKWKEVVMSKFKGLKYRGKYVYRNPDFNVEGE